MTRDGGGARGGQEHPLAGPRASQPAWRPHGPLGRRQRPDGRLSVMPQAGV